MFAEGDWKWIKYCASQGKNPFPPNFREGLKQAYEKIFIKTYYEKKLEKER